MLLIIVFRALTVMFEIMKSYRHTLYNLWWKEVFKLVFRIFETMKLHDQQIDWMEVSSNTVDLFQLLPSLLMSGVGYFYIYGHKSYLTFQCLL